MKGRKENGREEVKEGKRGNEEKKVGGRPHQSP